MKLYYMPCSKDALELYSYKQKAKADRKETFKLKENYNIYNRHFYDNMYESNKKTAENMMPIIIEILQPKSIIDIGCGEGIFLAAAKIVGGGIEVLGIDGEWIDKKHLVIAESEFLTSDISKPIFFSKRYDIALSLEVAEHIDKEFVETYIDNLIAASDVIVFSAAIKGQGGTNHVNEQYPSYWEEKFNRRGYVLDENLRRYFWNKKEIQPLRRQNILMYIKKDLSKEISERFRCYETQNVIDIVHPDFYRERLVAKQEMIEECQKQLKLYKIGYEILQNNIDYATLGKVFSKLSLGELIDSYVLIKENMQNSLFRQNFKPIIFSSKENTLYVLWGAGKDGRKIFKLLKALDIRIAYWVDENMKGRVIDGMMISSPMELNILETDFQVIIGSRKYEREIVTGVNKIGKNASCIGYSF